MTSYPLSNNHPISNNRTDIPTNHWKYIDELQRPLQYHDRTEHTLPSQISKVQDQLKEIVEYAKNNEMKVNKKKTKVMLFNSARTTDFTPRLKLEVILK